jgi:hypothetical protein
MEVQNYVYKTGRSPGCPIARPKGGIGKTWTFMDNWITGHCKVWILLIALHRLGLLFLWYCREDQCRPTAVGTVPVLNVPI